MMCGFRRWPIRLPTGRRERASGVWRWARIALSARCIQGLRWIRTWGELGKAANKARTIEKTVKTLEKAGRDGLADKMTRESADALTDLAQSQLADGLMEQAAKGAASGGQSDFAGVNVPIVGVGLQIGFWKLLDVETDLLTYTGCDECDHA